MSEVDPKLLEMAEVFHMPRKARMKYIILPAKAPGLAKLLGRKRGADRAEGSNAGTGGAHR